MRTKAKVAAAKARYAWRKGFPSRGVKASAAYRELEDLRRKNRGRLSPAIVLMAAKKPKSVLHKIIYKVRDVDAIRKYRAMLARDLLDAIRVIEVRILPSGDTEGMPPSRVFLRYEQPDGESGWGGRSEVLASPSARKYALIWALRATRSYRDRFSDILELRPVITEIDKLLIEYGNMEEEN